MVDRKRLQRLEAGLSYSPLPMDEIAWTHEPSLRLLTEDEAERLVPILQELGQHSERGAPTFWELAKLKPDQLDLLEAFVEKSEQGMKRLKSEGHPSVFQMNRIKSPMV